MIGHAQLAIWSDIEAHQQTDYLHWLTREHVLERVRVDGFLSGRVYRAESSAHCRFFIAYELVDARALVGASYLARLNDPTPWSQRTMPILQNFVRGGGSLSACVGLGWGGVVAPLRFALADTALAGAAAQQAMVSRLAALDGISRVWLMPVDAQATGVPTREKTMRRSAEGIFDAVLVVEGLHDEAVEAAVATLLTGEMAGFDVPDTTRFAACFALDRRQAGLTP